MDKAFFTFTNKARSPMLFAVFPFFNSCLSIVEKKKKTIRRNEEATNGLNMKLDLQILY